MGAAWKAFKVFLMVLGAIVAALFLFLAAFSGAYWLSQSQRFCHETMNSEYCTDMIALQGLIASEENFRFRNVIDNSQVAQLTTAYVGSSGQPTVRYKFVMRAKPTANSDASDTKNASKLSKEEIDQRFAKVMTGSVCDPTTTSLFRAEAPNMQAFLKLGGAIEFDLKVSDVTLDKLQVASFVAKQMTSLDSEHVKIDSEDVKNIYGGVHYALGPVTITSCEDKP